MLSSLVLYYDFVFYEIPNFIPLIITGLFIAQSLFLGIHFNLNFFLYSLIFVSIILFIASYYSLMGMGDVKLILALLPWAYGINLSAFLLYTTWAGAILAILYIIPSSERIITKTRWKICSHQRPDYSPNHFLTLGKIKHSQKKGVPYGIAIFFGFLITVLLPGK
tara:strand:- start:87 stop:581 length:495 start_codon:yes stop_codon:yes gene_type:complete